MAGLVAKGRTNRQIGRALGIAEKTAEVHVHNIIRKLDARSRGEVAAWVGAHGRRGRPGSGGRPHGLHDTGRANGAAYAWTR